MSSTSRLTRHIVPSNRWFTSSKQIEDVTATSRNAATATSATAHDVVPYEEDARLSRAQVTLGRFSISLREQLSRLRSVLPSTERSSTANSTFNVAKPFRSNSSHELIQHGKEIEQSFEDAMFECNRSVNQFYNLSEVASNGDEDITEQELSAQHTVTDQQPKMAPMSQAAKLALINQARIMSIPRSEVNNRMKDLTVNAMMANVSTTSKLTRLRELTEHIKEYPMSRGIAVKQGLVPYLLSLERSANKAVTNSLSDVKQLDGVVREALRAVGHSDPLNSKGIRILSIDGGGTRGLVAIETLKQLEILCQKPVHEMFDYIGGVSTGGLLAVLIGALRLPLDKCEQVYKDCSQRVFSRGTIAGTANLITRHSFFDTQIWENILKDEIGAEVSLLSTSREKEAPHIGIVSTVMSELPYNFVFRNYNHAANVISQYSGTSNAQIWQAIRASSAAPGYFEEFVLRDTCHQDGGVLNNNPTAIAIHEAKLLWPDEDIQCVVSLGNGRYEPTTAVPSPSFTSLRGKLGALIHSATGTEGVHTVLHDLLDPATYYRLNPYMSEDFMLNEINTEKQKLMQFETQMYLRRNASKLDKAGAQLVLKKTPVSNMRNWVKEKSESFTSKRV